MWLFGMNFDENLFINLLFFLLNLFESFDFDVDELDLLVFGVLEEVNMFIVNDDRNVIWFFKGVVRVEMFNLEVLGL